MSIDSFINGPQRENDLVFCKKYIELSDYYWQLADEDVLNSIEEALKSTLVDYQGGKLEGQFKGKSQTEIRNYFLVKKLRLYEAIPKELAERIQIEIDKYLRGKTIQAKRNGLIVPDYGSHLKVKEYLANYIVAQENKKILEFHLGKSI